MRDIPIQDNLGWVSVRLGVRSVQEVEPGVTGLRVLVVDDDEDIADLLARILRLSGHLPEAFSCSKRALRVFQEDSAAFDLLLTDLMMPGMNGEELARCCRVLRPDLPIVLHTGSRGCLRVEGVFDAVIEKPVSRSELEQVLAGLT